MISDAQEIPSEIPEQIKLPYLFNIQNNITYHIQMCHVLNVLDNHTISFEQEKSEYGYNEAYYEQLII